MTKTLDDFTPLEISDETARVNLMHENKSKLPLTPVSEILPREKIISMKNEGHLLWLFLSYMKIVLFYKCTFF